MTFCNIYVIFKSSIRVSCFTLSAGTFHLLFLISEDSATTEYFMNHIKKGGHLKSTLCLKYQTYIYIYIYIYLYIYIYNIYIYIYILKHIHT